VALRAGNAGVAGAAGTATAGGAAATHQAGQSILASDLAGAISTAAWPQLDPRDVRGSLPRFLTLIMALIHRYGTASSVHAAAFYKTARADAGIRGNVTVRPAPLPPAEQVTKSLEWATSGLYREVTPQTERAALTKVEGLTQTLALNMGRQTIIEAVKTDRQAKGWARVPRPARARSAYCWPPAALSTSRRHPPAAASSRRTTTATATSNRHSPTTTSRPPWCDRPRTSTRQRRTATTRTRPATTSASQSIKHATRAGSDRQPPPLALAARLLTSPGG
jgi:hypothetical protein